jgi:hypothetical protein
MPFGAYDHLPNDPKTKREKIKFTNIQHNAQCKIVSVIKVPQQ